MICKLKSTRLLALATLFTTGSKVVAKCVPGELLEGPTCYTFYKCVSGRFYTKKIKFDCPPGTIFHPEDSMCMQESRPGCIGGGPIPPAPFPSPTSGGKETLSPGKIPGPPSPPSPPAPSGGNALPPAQTGNKQCRRYEIDRTGVYDCISPGFFPSYGDCSNFYTCINTMGCILKGFYVSCPPRYVFEQKKSKCEEELIAGPCQFVQDAIELGDVQPTIKLKPSTQDQFFGASAYWEYMPFLQQQNQTRLTPSDVARGSRKTLLL